MWENPNESMAADLAGAHTRIAELKAEIMGLTSEIVRLRDRNAELERERDHWRDAHRIARTEFAPALAMKDRRIAELAYSLAMIRDYMAGYCVDPTAAVIIDGMRRIARKALDNK